MPERVQTMGSLSRRLRRYASVGGDLQQRIAELRRRMRDERDISLVIEQLVLIACELMFEPAREVRRHAPLLEVARAAARSYEAPLRDHDGLLLHVPEHSLWYGPLGAEESTGGMVLYFEDLQRGAVYFRHRGVSHYFRFFLPDEFNSPDAVIGDLKLESITIRRGGGGAAN